MMTKFDTPIFITGIERSGSSIVAKVINNCGAFAGLTTEMQENRGIKNLVDTLYVQCLKVPSNGQFPLPEIKGLLTPTTFLSNIKLSLQIDGYDESKLWMYKSSKLCQIHPIWNDCFPNAKWIIVRRRTADIVSSCLKTGYMKAYDNQEGWLEWVHIHEKLFAEMLEAKINYKEVYPERMAYGDFTQMQEVVEWLGLTWNTEIPKIVKPLLNNSIQKERSL